MLFLYTMNSDLQACMRALAAFQSLISMSRYVLCLPFTCSSHPAKFWHWSTVLVSVCRQHPIQSSIMVDGEAHGGGRAAPFAIWRRSRAHLRVCLAMTFNLELCGLIIHVEVLRGVVATHFSIEKYASTWNCGSLDFDSVRSLMVI
jgi:hypothetical protein